jgi:hypothetical protein
MHNRKHLTILPAVAIAAAAIAGCGSSTNGVESKSPKEIVSEAQKAAEGARSVRVTGSVASAAAPLSLDLQIKQSVGAKGKISEGPLSFELVRVGENVYIKGSSQFYKHFGGTEAAKLLQGKWLKAPAGSGEFRTLGGLTDIHALFDTLLAEERGASLARGATSTVNGQKVVAVQNKSKGGVLYVATTGKPFPIRVSKSGGTGGTVTFSDWNAPGTISAPAASETIDISKLRSGT